MSHQDDDDTFARTFVGIEKLRGRSHDDDWLEWRRLVIQAIKSGKQVEEKVSALIAERPKYARQSAVTLLAARVAALEDEKKKRESTRSKLIGFAIKAALLILAALLGRNSK